MLKLIINYRSMIFFNYALKPTLTIPLQHRCSYPFGFFKTNWKSKDYMITKQIKAAVKSEQLKSLIKERGNLMNIINLTAILDRIQEQQMLNINQIVEFVIQKLKQSEYLFFELTGESFRSICNIICYLGNLRKQELNYIFEQINYLQVIRFVNPIEKTMLVNGLIRLDLFHSVFVLKPKIKTERQLYFSEEFLGDLNTNQILSIWLAFCDRTKLKNQEINQIILNVLTSEKGQANDEKITLKTYAYAMICYTEMYHRVKLRKSGRLYEIVRFQIPNRASKKQYLLPHELSQFLKALRNFQKKMQAQDKSSLFKFSQEFQTLLNLNFKIICQNRNITLRNISNIYKQFSERFKLSSETFKVMCNSIIAILKQEIEYVGSREEYKFEYKIDLLSLCSLTWKINEIQKNSVQLDIFKQNLVLYLSKYMLSITKFQVLGSIPAKELLMLYSGLYQYSRNHELILASEFQILLISLITNQKLNLTLKELTLFYTYFKQMKIGQVKLCHFLRKRIQEEDQKTMEVNQRAEEILDKKGCLMELGTQCQKCFEKNKNSADI